MTRTFAHLLGLTFVLPKDLYGMYGLCKINEYS